MSGTSLRPYQQEGETSIFNAWKKGHKNVMYQLPTGGGKTVLFVDIIKKFLYKNKRVVLLAHREELITQAWNTLYKNQIYAGIIKADVAPQYALPCQVASIQTVIRRKQLPAADIVIIDEAHHSQEDNSYGKVLDEHWPRAYVLGVTATPYRLNGKGFTNMFDELVLGPKISDLIAWGYLTPLRYFIAGIPDLSKVKMQAGDYNSEQAEEAMKFVPLVDSYLEHCRGMSGVVFAVNVHHSEQIVHQYNEAGIRAAHLDANTPTAERQNILKLFREKKITIISNVGIITEGFDFPDMEFVQLARPTLSLSLYLQMVGRVTRTDYQAIKDAVDDEDRARLVSLSKKPFGYVLDNAGLYKNHGLPDRAINWPTYFEGFDKRKKKALETIEIIEYVAEDSDGRTVRTNLPEEVDGLKLVEINHTVKERIVNITSLKEFDRLTEMFKRIPKIEKKGFAVFNNFKTFCKKQSILMTPEVWDYIYKKLWTEPQDLQAKILSERDQAVAVIQNQYGSDSYEADHLIKVVREDCDRKIKRVIALQVPGGFIRKEQRAYEAIEADLQNAAV